VFVHIFSKHSYEEVILYITVTHQHVTKVYFNKVKILPQLLVSDVLKPKAQLPLSHNNNVYALIEKLYMYCYQRLA